MGRPKGSKNGVRKVSIEKAKFFRRKTGPVFDKYILAMYTSTYYPACIESIDQYMENNSNTDENMNHYKVLQAAALIQLGDKFDEAHQVLDEVISVDPVYSSAYFNKGVAYFCQKKYEQSLEMLEKAQTLNPESEKERVSYFKMRIDCSKRRVTVKLDKMACQQEVLDGNIENGTETINAAIPDNLTTANTEITTVKCEKPAGDLSDTEVESLKREIGRPKKEEWTLQIPEGLPKGFVAVSAQDFFAKGSELYSVGMLKAAQEKFEKALELDPTFTEAMIMAEKADELIDFVELAGFNLKMKKYRIVTEIVESGLEVDVSNDFVNRMLYYFRGMAFYELGEKAKCDQDFVEFQRLDKILN